MMRVPRAAQQHAAAPTRLVTAIAAKLFKIHTHPLL